MKKDDILSIAQNAMACMVEKKGIDPIIIDVNNMTTIADYFIICSCASSRHVKSMSDFIQRYFKGLGIKLYGIEGISQSHWILMDYGDVVIHIFYEPVRKFIDLEGLWSEAKIITSDDTELPAIKGA